jgi:hypothetical protein
MSIKIITVSDGLGSATAPSIVDVSGSQVFHITITETNINLGYVTLPTIPASPTNSLLCWQGVNQQYEADYNISGSRLNILPRLMELIQENDFLTLYYQ